MKKLGLCILCLLCSIHLLIAQTQNITGVVLDDLGEHAVGVSVFIKGTTNGVMTDVDGKFSINAQSGDILVFSFIRVYIQ